MRAAKKAPGARQFLPTQLTDEQAAARTPTLTKVEGPRAAGGSTGARRAGSAGAGGFSLPAEDAKAISHAQPVSSLSAVHSVLALQVDGAGNRQRQTRRGAAQLDALDRLQAALLAGEAAPADLARLAEGLKSREPTGDPGLDSVLNEIDVRAAVELAKRTRSGAMRA